MKRKFLAAAVLGVMVSVTPAGAYAASTETSPLPVNSESDTAAQAEDEETTPLRRQLRPQRLHRVRLRLQPKHRPQHQP